MKNLDHHLESLLQLFPELLKLVDKLIDIFNRLHPILKNEHAAVMAHDLDELNKVIIEKQKVSGEFENDMSNFIEYANRFAQKIDESNKIDNLTDLEKLIKSLSQETLEEGLKANIWFKNLVTLKSRLKSFRVVSELCYPEIKKNKFIVERLLRNHQASFHFWQRVQDESSQPYNDNGSLKKAKNNAHINIKA